MDHLIDRVANWLINSLVVAVITGEWCGVWQTDEVRWQVLHSAWLHLETRVDISLDKDTWRASYDCCWPTRWRSRLRMQATCRHGSWASFHWTTVRWLVQHRLGLGTAADQWRHWTDYHHDSYVSCFSQLLPLLLLLLLLLHECHYQFTPLRLWLYA